METTSMGLHNHFYDGTRRPSWSDPVRTTSSRLPARGGQPSQAVRVSGVIVPLDVPPGRRAHRAGLGLGFPDLTRELLKHPSISKQWSSLERTLADAAVETMGWNSRSGPRSAARAAVPPHALQLTLSGVVRQPDGGRGGKSGGNLDDARLQGSLQKVFAIHDKGGHKSRLQPVGSPAAFQVGPSSVSFSRDPRRL